MEDTEPAEVNILSYWASRQKPCPTLAEMVCQYLSIPATSAASERVFSKGRRIVLWQRASLKPRSIEQLLCLKCWYQSFSSIF
ncbi:uncharacterized protein VP01_3343g2 [Puccinia sorghi]|uniref:HAT C-terminal dimerisation domain-containing protein n=1 Tax=Puccinia sorghi TaxID=27349 RepID=A0A0L6UX35_9BASI|nr:uncharacterized protein VP01_3343g2 [Puccinia sorghi]